MSAGWNDAILLDALLISLSANLANSLDIMPGRAAKGVLIWSIIFGLLIYNQGLMLIIHL